jgi:glucose-1-phosphate cytidylyltransferase
MKAVILCGGQGTRIRDAHESLPKPMLPIGGHPIVWHIMKGYEQHGVRDFVLCLGYKGWLIKQWFLNYRAMSADLVVRLGPEPAVEAHGPAAEDWRVVLAETGESTMTGGRIAAIRRWVADDELFLLTYGDGVSDVDIRAAIEFHRRHGKIATVTAVHPPGRFGELELQGSRVAAFAEKPQTTSGSINGGFFVLDAKRVWDYIPDSPSTVFEDGPLRALADAGELMAFEHRGFWQPMDTLRELTLLNRLWDEGLAPWKTWREPSDRAAQPADHAEAA